MVDVTNWPESPRQASKVIDDVRCQLYLRLGNERRGAMERSVVESCSKDRLLFGFAHATYYTYVVMAAI